MERTRPPEFGPNGAVLQSPSMTDEKRAPYDRATPGVGTWQHVWLPWGLVFVTFATQPVLRRDEALWLVTVPLLVQILLVALKLHGASGATQRKWSQRGWVVSFLVLLNAIWFLHYEVPVWSLTVPNGLVLASIFRNVGSRSRMEQGIWIGIMLACFLALPSFAERV